MLAATGSPSGSGWSGGPEADNVVAGGTGHGLEQKPVVEDVEQLGVDPDSEQLPGPGGALRNFWPATVTVPARSGETGLQGIRC